MPVGCAGVDTRLTVSAPTVDELYTCECSSISLSKAAHPKLSIAGTADTPDPRRSSSTPENALNCST